MFSERHLTNNPLDVLQILHCGLIYKIGRLWLTEDWETW